MTGEHALPQLLTCFIGRHAELEQLTALVRVQRLVTVVGSGGCGKTRIAIEAARALTPHFPDGVIFADLARISEPSMVAHGLGSALSVHESAGPTMATALQRAIGERDVLVLVDNAEHVVDELAPLLSEIMRSVPNAHFLITSRRPLGASGECVWRLPPLRLPETSHPVPQGPPSCEALDLFVSRASNAAAGTHWDERRLASALSICTRLDGIPLAIELAAARAGALGMDDLDQIVSRGLEALTASPGAELQRHATLRAAIDWSYRLLGELEQATFRCLSVFSGGATLAQIESVCGHESAIGPTVVECISHLVEQSMVTRVEREGAADRYRLLEPLRDFAREELDAAGETEAVSRCHADYFLHFAEGEKAHLRDSRQPAAVRLLDSENDNIRTALEWFLAAGDYTSAARIVVAMHLFWRIRARHQEARSRGLAVAAAAPADSPWRGRALRVAGCAEGALGNLDKSIECLEEAVRLERPAGDRRELAESLCWLGQAYEVAHQSAPAFACSEEARSLLASGDVWLRALDLRVRAHAEKVRTGDMDAVQHLHEEEYVLCKQAGDYLATAKVLNCLAEFARWHGEFDRAESLYRESLSRRDAIGDEGGTVLSLVNLALLAAQTGNSEAALGYAEDAHERMRRIGSPLLVCTLFLALGAIAARMHRFALAARLLGLSRESANAEIFDPPDEQVFALARELCIEGTSLQEFESALALGRFADASLAGSEAATAIAEMRDSLHARRPELAVVSKAGGLSERESEVIQLLTCGLSNRDIAERLILSTRTVETHVANAYNKLGVNNRAEATARAFALGLVPSNQLAG